MSSQSERAHMKAHEMSERADAAAKALIAEQRLQLERYRVALEAIERGQVLSVAARIAREALEVK